MAVLMQRLQLGAEEAEELVTSASDDALQGAGTHPLPVQPLSDAVK